MNDSAPILETKSLTKIYVMGQIQVTALNDVSLRVISGKFLGVAGASGSGKSTLMNLMGGLDTPTSGTIMAQGKIVSELNRQELALYRRYGVGMIFQSFNLIPSLTAIENVGLPLLFAGVSKADRNRKAAVVLEKLGLAARQTHKPSELSGGEQQRVAIARALVNDPEILLADEPTGNLDSQTSRDIVQTLAEFNSKQNLTVIMVSHEKDLLQEYANEIITLQDGAVKDQENIK